MNETLRLIGERTSLREYADRPIDREDVDRIIESAMRAPTAGNMMLYTILEVVDPLRKGRLAETCGHAFVGSAPLVLLFLADLQRWVDLFECNGVPERCAERGLAYRTPDPSKLLMGCCDALVAAQTSVIAAESMGIGSCYVGDVLGHAEEHRALFGLPAFVFPIALVCYGHCREGRTTKRADRFNREFVHHRDAYRRFSPGELAEMVADVEAKFAKVIEERQVSLAELTYRGFMAGTVAIQERRSVSVLLEPWFAGDRHRAGTGDPAGDAPPEARAD